MTIDPEVQAFVAESDAFYPPDAATRSIADQRRLYEAYAVAFGFPRPTGMVTEDGCLALPDRSVPLRLYRPHVPARGTIIYAHGGGFLLGSLDSHDGIVARIAARTRAVVIAVDYRLVPEHPAPAARDDILATVDAHAAATLPWDIDRGLPLVLAGDSAGATLVASAALLRATSPGPPPAGLALVYPMLGREPASPARDTEAFAPMLSLADVYVYRDAYLSGRPPDAWTFPLDAPSVKALPPAFLLAAEHDPLRDDCAAFAARIRAGGGSAELVIGAGLVHGFLRAIDRSSGAVAAFDSLIQFLNTRFDTAQP